MMSRATAISLAAWLLINFVLTSMVHYVLKVGHLLGVSGSAQLVLFFTLVLLLIALNIMFLLRAKGILLRAMFVFAIIWIAFFAIMVGSVNTIDILFNFNFLLRGFANLL